jgi:hypothetical protein
VCSGARVSSGHGQGQTRFIHAAKLMLEHRDRSVAAVGDEIGQSGCAILVSAFLTVVSASRPMSLILRPGINRARMKYPLRQLFTAPFCAPMVMYGEADR